MFEYPKYPKWKIKLIHHICLFLGVSVRINEIACGFVHPYMLEGENDLLG